MIRSVSSTVIILLYYASQHMRYSYVNVLNDQHSNENILFVLIRKKIRPKIKQLDAHSRAEKLIQHQHMVVVPNSNVKNTYSIRSIYLKFSIEKSFCPQICSLLLTNCSNRASTSLLCQSLIQFASAFFSFVIQK